MTDELQQTIDKSFDEVERLVWKGFGRRFERMEERLGLLEQELDRLLDEKAEGQRGREG